MHIINEATDTDLKVIGEEAKELVSQNVVPHKKYLSGFLPYVVTEQIVTMFSSVLNCERAIHVNIAK